MLYSRYALTEVCVELYAVLTCVGWSAFVEANLKTVATKTSTSSATELLLLRREEASMALMALFGSQPFPNPSGGDFLDPVLSLVSTCSTPFVRELKKNCKVRDCERIHIPPWETKVPAGKGYVSSQESITLLNVNLEGSLYCQASRRQVSSLLASALERMVHRAFHAWHSLKVEI